MLNKYIFFNGHGPSLTVSSGCILTPHTGGRALLLREAQAPSGLLPPSARLGTSRLRSDLHPSLSPPQVSQTLNQLLMDEAFHSPPLTAILNTHICATPRSRLLWRRTLHQRGPWTYGKCLKLVASSHPGYCQKPGGRAASLRR